MAAALEKCGAKSTYMLSTHQLTFHYPGGPSFTFPDVACAPGEHLVILGESGKGKTTLLHLLAGLLKPTAGAVRIAGTETSALSGAALDRFRGQHVGVIFQTAHFVASLSVLDNLLLPNYLTGTRQDKQRAEQLLERLQLKDKAHRKPAELSVGEQQRVTIARAVMNKPALLLADEPTSALDDRNAAHVISLLEEQAAETGAALIIVTHDQRIKDHFQHRLAL